MKRREFLRHTAGAGFSLLSAPLWANRVEDAFPPVQAITQGPEFHWFGYYDKYQTDPSGSYVLGMQVAFEGRTPEAQDTIKIGIIDLQNRNKWRELGESKAWGWQQGCMLQWIPGSPNEVIWNDREDDKFVSHILNVKTGKRRTLPKAVYALSPNGKFAVGTEFSRIQNLRPGYGYAGIPDPYEQQKAPREIGLYRLYLKTGKNRLLISLADMAALPHEGKAIEDNYHWFNHLLISPDSKRLVFLHRWRAKKDNRQRMACCDFLTRMFTVGVNGKKLYLLDPAGYTSHFIWRDPKHVCAWMQPKGQPAAFYLLKDKTDDLQLVDKVAMPYNGHNTYVPNTNNEWILNDTYPYHNAERLQELYLYHVPTRRKVMLGRFHEPLQYTGEWRCDLHPRCDHAGTKVFFDSTHGGNGRQMYMIDIKQIIKG
ncbi:MAG: hypothetical protein ACO1OF_17615 [Adhaeribacter sp.]